jgi:hypothetical protein
VTVRAAAETFKQRTYALLAHTPSAGRDSRLGRIGASRSGRAVRDGAVGHESTQAGACRWALTGTSADSVEVDENPQMTLGIYARVIASKADHGAALDELVGTSAPLTTPDDEVEHERAR